MTNSELITLAAKDALVRTYRSQILNWTADEWWHQVRQVRATIDPNRLPALREVYKL